MRAEILVVIPTCNRPALCRRAVDSLLAQQSKDWVLVIAKNGGSRDLDRYFRTLKAKLNDARVRMLVLPEAGLGYALNEAVGRYGDYEYFAVLEDDDEWKPEFLATLRDAMVTTGADVVHCRQRQTPEPKQSDGAPMDKERLRIVNWINFPMCLFRMELFGRLRGFTNAAGPATDWDWNLRCVAAGARYEFIDRALVTHHWHDDNYCVKVDGRPFVMERLHRGVYG